MKLKNKFFELLKREAINKMVFSLLGKSVGIKAWLIKGLLEYGFDEIVKPLFNLAVRKGWFFYDAQKGKLIAKRMDDASDRNDQDAYDSAWDDMFK